MAPKKREKAAIEEEPARPSKSQKKDKGKSGALDVDSTRKARVQKLLSDEIQSLAYPEISQGHGEIDWPAEKGKKTPPSPPKNGSGQKESKENVKYRDYTSPDLTPFEQLICAILLSKPISHQLGLRAIRTLLSSPFSLTTPTKMAEAGFEGRREALWEARTQHKEKTATQLGDLVDGLRKIMDSSDNNEDEEEAAIDLVAVRNEAKQAKSHLEAIEKVRSLLTSNIKGLGPTGVDIFLRQVQKQKGWESLFPFVDARGLKVAIHFGLVEDSSDAEQGAKVLSKLVNKDKVKFVKLLDILIGLDLEKKSDQVLKQVF